MHGEPVEPRASPASVRPAGAAFCPPAKAPPAQAVRCPPGARGPGRSSSHCFLTAETRPAEGGGAAVEDPAAFPGCGRGCDHMPGCWGASVYVLLVGKEQPIPCDPRGGSLSLHPTSSILVYVAPACGSLQMPPCPPCVPLILSRDLPEPPTHRALIRDGGRDGADAAPSASRTTFKSGIFTVRNVISS